MKILIADDHAVVRAGLKQILTGVSGVTEIDGVADGDEVIQFINITEVFYQSINLFLIA